jgi:sec-independent protein translocase protein TatA
LYAALRESVTRRACGSTKAHGRLAMTTAFMLGIHLGHWEIIIIVAVAVLLFGSRLPSIARSLGKSVVEFKKGVKGMTEDIEGQSEPKKIEDSREVKGDRVQLENAEDENAEKVSS